MSLHPALERCVTSPLVAVSLVLVVAAPLRWLSAQAPAEPALPPIASARSAPLQEMASGALRFDLRVPVHTRDDQDGGTAYGTWAAGESFKCSFHDGFVFYPTLGADYAANLPLRWRTVAVGTDGAELLDGNELARHESSDWRYEYRHRAFVEAYDVLAEGVEQSFVIADRPAGGGALRIRGAITTALHAAARAAQHDAIEFCDDSGQALVRYGEAWAIDADGRRCAVASSFDGAHIELHVDAAFVDRARFPLTIDPLTSRVVVSGFSGSFGLPFAADVCHESQNATANTFVCFARQSSFTDLDVYGYLTDADYSNAFLVLALVTASTSDSHPQVAAVGGAQKWCVSYQRGSNVEVYVHPFLDRRLNPGLFSTVSSRVGFGPPFPVIGGQAVGTLGSLALVAWVERGGIKMRLIDANTGAGFGSGSPPLLPTPTTPAFPVINQENGGNSRSWIVGWVERPSSRGELWAARITWDGFEAGRVRLGQLAGGPDSVGLRIAGSNDRYLATWTDTSSASTGYGFRLQAQRFDWTETSATPVVYAIRTLDTVASDVLANEGLAYDTISQSHWCALYRSGTAFQTASLLAKRVGFSGGVVESATVYAGSTAAGGYDGGVTFDRSRRQFKIAHCTTEPQLPVYGLAFGYPSTAINVPYGVGCGGAILARRPDAGFEFFTIDVDAGPPHAGQPAWLGIGASPAAIGLGVIGMPSCSMNVNFAVLLGPFPLNANGIQSRQIRLPDLPLFIGDLFFQWLYVSPGAPWPLKLRTTTGLRSQVR